MRVDREARLASIENAIDGRALVWFGIRALDAQALLHLPSFTASFGVTMPILASIAQQSATLEEITGERVDLDRYDIDADRRPEVDRLRAAMSRTVARRSLVVSYRPSRFIDDLALTAGVTAARLGLPTDIQRAFEFKPWVETELQERNVRTIPWTYVNPERLEHVADLLGDGPLVLRPSRSSGGVGIQLIRDREEIGHLGLRSAGGPLAVAPFFEDAVPLNVNAVVYRGGHVRLHPLSVQFIGVPELTSLTFGYCGNDFSACHDASPGVLRQVTSITTSVGEWLAGFGYRGGFGVDFLVDGELVFFTELNPRLQGSSRMSAAISVEAGAPDLLTEHLAAQLGLHPPSDDLSVPLVGPGRPSQRVVHEGADTGATQHAPAGQVVSSGVSGMSSVGGAGTGTVLRDGAVRHIIEHEVV